MGNGAVGNRPSRAVKRFDVDSCIYDRAFDALHRRRGEHRCLIYQCVRQPSVHRVTPAIVRPRREASINRGLTSRQRGTAESDVIATSNGEWTMSDETLKPCPFCGADGVKAICCGKAVPDCSSCADLFGCFQCDVWMDTLEEWNTRVSPPDARPVSFLESEL